MVSTHPGALATRQPAKPTKPALAVAWLWSVVVLAGVGVVVLTTSVGPRALIAAGVPLALCILVTALVGVGDEPRNLAAGIGIFVCGMVMLVALISFVVPALVVVPTCAALIAACSYRVR